MVLARATWPRVLDPGRTAQVQCMGSRIRTTAVRPSSVTPVGVVPRAHFFRLERTCRSPWSRHYALDWGDHRRTV